MSMTGRKTIISKAIIKAVAEGIETGLSNRDAAVVAGISERTYYDWLQRGEAEAARLAQPGAKKRKSEALFVQFSQSIKKAIPLRKQSLVGQIKELAHGIKWERKKNRYEVRRDEDGVPMRDPVTDELMYDLVSFEKINEFVPPSLNAAGWLLERLHPSEYGHPTLQAKSGELWMKDLLNLYTEGGATREAIIDQLGPEYAEKFFEYAGLLPLSKSERNGPLELGISGQE